MVENNRVLSIHWGFSLGGVAKYAALLEEAGKQSHIKIKSVVIVADSWHVDRASLEALEYDLIVIKSRLDFSWFKRLVGIIKKENPALLLTHGFNGHVISWLIRNISGIVTLWACSYHGEYHANTISRRLVSPTLNRMSEWWIKTSSLAVISVSEYSREHLVRRGIDPEKITVVHNGIENHEAFDVDRIKVRQELNVSDEQILVGVISRLDPVKGIEYLLDAVASPRLKNNDIRVAVVGSGSMESDLKQRVIKLGIEDRVIFAGYRTDVEACLSALDIFVLPSLAEYHSIALLEAMRAGKIIVATDVGGNTESVRDGIEGTIVPSMNSTAIADALSRCIDDKTSSETMANAARARFVAEFTVQKMVAKTGAWLKNTVARANPRQHNL